ncbi:MAG: DUF1311 domain-containing protein [Succinivibrionaceae bacterium]|nr:DUF1311 domain-containing protein [Succinivibrionaceae bacterium]
MKTEFIKSALTAAGVCLLAFATPLYAAGGNVSENIPTPLEFCNSAKNTSSCIGRFTSMWQSDLDRRFAELAKNCLENAFCSKQLADLNDLWLDYTRLLEAFLKSHPDFSGPGVTYSKAYLVSLQFHVLALGYGCSADSALCTHVAEEKPVSYGLPHLVSFYTGLNSDVLWDDAMREAAIMEIDDVLNDQYRKARDQVLTSEEDRTDLRRMEIAWIKYKEKMLNYLEDPLASGTEAESYFNSDMFLMLTSLHQARILGFRCEDGSMKCVAQENKLRESAREYEKTLEAQERENSALEEDYAPSVIDVSEVDGHAELPEEDAGVARHIGADDPEKTKSARSSGQEAGHGAASAVGVGVSGTGNEPDSHQAGDLRKTDVLHEHAGAEDQIMKHASGAAVGEDRKPEDLKPEESKREELKPEGSLKDEQAVAGSASVAGSESERSSGTAEKQKPEQGESASASDVGAPQSPAALQPENESGS